MFIARAMCGVMNVTAASCLVLQLENAMYLER
jgi:hypothetical protein